MRFTWDPAKARSNLAKHGVSFEEAASALLDPFAIDAPDLVDPARTIVIGMSGRNRVLFTVTIIHDEDELRIISARRATPAQRRKYEKAP